MRPRERYRELGLGELVTTPDDEPGHVYHLFVSRSPERDRIVAALRDADIGCATYYLPPLHLQPALRYLGYAEGSLPETERLARENFSVPLWAGITSEQQERVVDVVRSAVGVGRMTLPISRHRILNLLADAVLIAAAWWLTFWIRFDQCVPSFYEHLLSWQTFAIVIGIKLSVFVLFGFYNRWWRYVSTRDMWGAARGVVVASLLVDLTSTRFRRTTRRGSRAGSPSSTCCCCSRSSRARGCSRAR